MRNRTPFTVSLFSRGAIGRRARPILLLVLFAGLCQAGATGSAFTYQGELNHLGARANGAFDFRFEVFDLATGGGPIAGPLLLDDVAVVDGVFTVELNFGSAPFDGDALWLGIGVREGAGAYTGLLPRQKVTAVPYALQALNDADNQDLSLNANTLSLTNDASSVDLSAYLDNTDDQTLSEVLGQGNNAGAQSIVNLQNIIATGTTTTAALTVSGLNCSGNANGGALTANSRGMVFCSDDDDSPGNTLDGAYDQGGAGAGRAISADSGPVVIQGAGGLDVDGGDLLQLPGNPVLAGTLAIGAGPFSVVVSGPYAYVIDSLSDDLKVIDVSDPATPSLAGSLGIGFNPTSVFVSGRYAYVVDLVSDDLKVIDVSDPSTPSLAGSLGIGTNPRSVVVSGRYAYVVDSGSDDLKVIDVSDPSTPSLAGSLGIGSPPTSVFVSGRYAYVVGFGSDLNVIDVSDPSTPSLAGSLALGAVPRSVYVSGRYAYVVDGSSVLQVIDVSDPSAPSVAGSLALGAIPSSVYVSGRYAYVVDAGSDLQVIDVSDPSTPSLAGSLGIGTNPNSVFVSGRYAYAVDSGSGDLKVIDISGAEVTSLLAHSLEAGNLQVRNDIIAQGQLQVTGGVNVGSGGLFSDGNVGISGTIAIANDIAPTTSPANLVQLYAEDVAASSELKVRDEAGNITTLSPHNFSLIGAPSEPMAWSFFSENAHGKINVDMLRAMRLIEGISGERLVHIQSTGTTEDDRSEAVPKTPDRRLALPLIEAVMALQQDNQKKEAEIARLNANNGLLERRLAALENRVSGVEREQR